MEFSLKNTAIDLSIAGAGFVFSIFASVVPGIDVIWRQAGYVITIIGVIAALFSYYFKEMEKESKAMLNDVSQYTLKKELDELLKIPADVEHKDELWENTRHTILENHRSEIELLDKELYLRENDALSFQAEAIKNSENFIYAVHVINNERDLTRWTQVNGGFKESIVDPLREKKDSNIARKRITVISKEFVNDHYTLVSEYDRQQRGLKFDCHYTDESKLSDMLIIDKKYLIENCVHNENMSIVSKNMNKKIRKSCIKVSMDQKKIYDTVDKFEKLFNSASKLNTFSPQDKNKKTKKKKE